MFKNALLSFANEARDPRIAFWSDQSKWPEDCREYVFAGRGLLWLGRRLFGEAWSDACATTELTFELPETFNLYTDIGEVRRAVRLLQKAGHRPEGSLLQWAFRDGLVFPTQDEWDLSRGIAKREATQSWDAFWPFLATARRLSDAARNGDLETASAEIYGGEVREEPWHFWNFADRVFRFDTCRVHGGGAISRGEQFDASSRWLYFKRNSLEALGNGLSGKLPASAEEAPTKKALKAVKKGRVGRQTEHEWRRISQEFGMRAARGDWTDMSNQQVAAELALFCQNEWGREPADSALRSRVAEWRNALGYAEN